jgi:mono/diheme cytochrome c family protein
MRKGTLMDSRNRRSPWPPRFLAVVAGLGLLVLSVRGQGTAPQPAADLQTDYATVARPLVTKYCLECHSTKGKKGGLDLERFASLDHVRKDLKPWQQMIEMLEAGEMPPRRKPQPTADERKQLIGWVRGFLDTEARARAGDPGHVPLRRLSNAEYDCTIRDLTGVDLRPTREFPADGAAGEGFTNAAEALADVSPALLSKYLNAAKDVAERAVLLPDGFRFSPTRTRRDWTDESLARLRTFYAEYTADGRLPLAPYLAATVRHREALLAGKTTPEEVARQEKLNPKYLGVLWRTLKDRAPSYPLDRVRARWRRASENDLAALAAEITAWQAALWQFVPVGSYRYGNTVRQVANDPAAADTQPLRLAVKPAPGQKEVVLYLVTRDAFPAGQGGQAVWHRPRFESAGKPPLLLGDYPQFGPASEAESGLPKEPGGTRYGIEIERFGRHPAGKPVDDASLVVAANTVTEVRLPAALFRGREFVVEGKLDPAPGDRVVWFQVRTTPPAPDTCWDGKGPVVASPTGAAYRQLLQGHADFRRCFPQFLCFPRIIPDDEVVCLKMYHREDEPLARLFLDDGQKRRLDRLWDEHRFISQQPVAENNYLPQFIGFVTQDQPKELLAYFEGQRETFRKRAEEFEKDTEAAIPKQWEVLVDFAARAYRRPLHEQEKTGLLGLYRTLRAKGATHDEAFRGVLTRVLVAPPFLFRIERAPPGKAPGPVNDWELATRLSYFLWSSAPDDELRRLAAAGRLREPQVLAEQTRRMLREDRARALAVEFGTQWLHVRGFDEFKEKNEKLFPTFDANLRRAIYEESILFFQDLFQGDRSVTQILDADYTFLNELLAKHYGIPGVAGPQWRRVEGVRQYGRGGILGLASVQAKQSGASRTSPVLRGNWVVETLLGEKLPRPPANVPRLPEEEGGADRLTTRQLVEKHARVAECAVCHQRIDPFGFALERYDAIGRRRDQDLGGLAVDARATLKDGTAFDGIDGLRTYLLTKKKDVIVRLFCRKLLGYALGRAVALSDQTLIDEMVQELTRNDGRLSSAVLAIVRSPQFRSIRGGDFASDQEATGDLR